MPATVLFDIFSHGMFNAVHVKRDIPFCIVQIGGAMLRLLVLGVRAQRPRCYYLSFQVLAPGTPAAVAFPTSNDGGVQEATALPPDMVCRTETASMGKCPEFTNRAFLLRLPCTPGASSSSSSSGTGPALAVQLFAAPSPEDPAGPIVAGKEVDPLIAHGSVDLVGSDVGARLAAGERVMVPLQLSEPTGTHKHQQQLPGGLCGQTAQLQSLRSSLAANAAANLYGSSDTQVLLELHLLNAELPQIPTSSSMHQTARSMNFLAPTASAGRLNQSLEVQQQQEQLHHQQQWGGSQSPGRPRSRNAQATTTAAAGPHVELFVLVSAATNLPMVPGPDAQQLVPPHAFVTLKSLADVAARRPAQATTHVAKTTQHPVWSQLLQLSYPERDLPHEQLHIAASHEGDSGQCRVLVRGSLRLATLIPGQYYNLAVALSDSCTLYLTLVLGLGAATQHDALQGCGIAARATSASLRLLQLRFVASSQPLHSLFAAAGLSSVSSGGIWAVWRARPRPQSSKPQQQQQQQQQQLYAPLDGREGSEKAGAGVLRNINGSTGLLSTAVVAASDTGDDGSAAGGVVAALPLLSLPETGETLWPPDHTLLLPCWTTSATAAVLELYFQPHISASSSSSKSSSKGLPLATCFARLELPYSTIASQQCGRTSIVGGLQLTAVGAATPAAGVKSQPAVACTFEVVAWKIAAYLDHLKQLAAAAVPAAASKQAAAAAATTTASNLCLEVSSPRPDNSLATLSTTPKVRGSTANNPCAAADNTQDLRQLDAFETLIGDSLAKQQALERLQRSLDVADSRREAAACRIADLQSTNSRLTADLQHLRQLLHEEKEAQAAAISTNSSATNPTLANATREELFEQLDIVAAAHAKERARNGELVHRLQQLHAEQVDVIELQKQYAELQDAHYQQSQLLTDQDAAAATIAALKKAVTDQETVISRLESLLAAAVSRSKEGETWRSTADALQLEVLRLRDEIARLAAACPADEIAAAAARAAAAAAEQQVAAAALVQTEGAVAVTIAEYESRLSSKESDRLAAQMRAEKAEAAATAAQNELLDVTKRYAREIAQLKTKLAEKDAQLLGGFGSLANLYLSELPGGVPALNLNPAMGLLSPGPAGGLGLGQIGGVQGFGGLSGSELEGLGMGSGIGFNPSWAVQAGAGSAAAAAAAVRAGVAPNAAAAAAAAAAGSRITSAGRAASPKLQPISADNTAATAAAGGGYSLRAGTAESVLGTTKPGSPLVALSVQRLTNSAEGVRSSNGRLGLLGDGSRGSTGAAAGSQQQRQQQQQRCTRDLQLEAAGSSGCSVRGGSPNLAASPATAAAAAAQSGRFAGTAAAAVAAAESPGRSPVATGRSARMLALQQQQQQRSPGQMAAEEEDGLLEEEDMQEEVGADDGNYEGSGYTDDGLHDLSATAADQLLQLQMQLQQQQGRGQLIASAAQRQQQQRQQQQQQQRLRSPAGQLTPQYLASGAGEADAGGQQQQQQQQQPPAKMGLRKWFG